MVDFTTPKRRPRKSRSNVLFAGALFILGLVGYAFVESAIRPAQGGGAIASQSQVAHVPN